jgi:hypothetical protein
VDAFATTRDIIEGNALECIQRIASKGDAAASASRLSAGRANSALDLQNDNLTKRADGVPPPPSARHSEVRPPLDQRFGFASTFHEAGG